MTEARVYVDIRGRYRAVVAGDSVEVSAWGKGCSLRLTGRVAADVARGLDEGDHDSMTRARLQEVCRMLRPAAQKIATALLESRFATANPFQLIRRDGYDMIWIELLSRCNQSCVHCYASSHPSATDQLSPAVVQSILTQAAVLGFQHVQFTGGEPLLYQALPQMVEHARGCGLAVEIFTNAMLLDGPYLARLATGPVDFAVSLYGPSAGIHDAITREPGSWQKTVEAIQRIQTAGLGVRLAVVVMQANRAVANETAQFARSLSPRVRVGAVRQVGRGGFSQDDMEQAAAINGRERCEGPPAPDAPQGKVCVGPDGTVYPCIFTRWIALGRLGEDGDLEHILSNPKPRLIEGPAPDDAPYARQLACLECQDAACLLEGMCDGHTVS